MMAKIKETMTVSLEEFGKKAGEYALDEFEYKGLTIRQWADKITSGEYQPVKHGRWISQGDDMWLCSNCKENIIYSMHKSDRTEKQRYCCRCGARMSEV
jgi:hypothetical protein